MSHIEIHTIKSRKYKYEVTNYRVGKKVKHKWKYLGAVNPVNKRRNPNAGRKPKLKVRELTTEEQDFLKQNLIQRVPPVSDWWLFTNSKLYYQTAFSSLNCQQFQSTNT